MVKNRTKLPGILHKELGVFMINLAIKAIKGVLVKKISNFHVHTVQYLDIMKVFFIHQLMNK